MPSTEAARELHKETLAFFSQLFRYPDEELVDILRQEGVLLAEKQAWTAPPELSSLTDLEVQHTRLFINALGGAIAPPYASVYLDDRGEMMGESTKDILQFYQKVGLELAEESEPPDHISTILECLYLLEDQDEATIRSLRTSFIKRALLSWLPAFHSRLPSSSNCIYFWGSKELQKYLSSATAY